jgi:hypothetical protein
MEPKDDWTSAATLMTSGSVHCPRKSDNLIAFGRCQALRDLEECAECVFKDLVWFPTNKTAKSTYKKTCQKAGHVKGVIFVCKNCTVKFLYSYDCFDKGHVADIKEVCQTCGGK